jgi:hypothetical protein
MASWIGAWVDFRFELRELIDDRDEVLACGWQHGRAETPGASPGVLPLAGFVQRFRSHTLLPRSRAVRWIGRGCPQTGVAGPPTRHPARDTARAMSEENVEIVRRYLRKGGGCGD